MTFDLSSARGWVAQNQAFAARKWREGDIVGSRYFSKVAAAEQAKIDALIEAKALARELAEWDGAVADEGARLWYLLNEVVPETGFLDVIDADVIDDADHDLPPNR
jgi:hypothetical protein